MQACVDLAEYRPDVQFVQLVPSVLCSVSVIDPAAHAMHFLAPTAAAYWPATQLPHASVGSLEDFPFVHLVQLVPPLLLSVSVTEPAEQPMQSDSAVLFSDATYLPAEQLMHCGLPVEAAYLPAAQPTHASVDLLEYVPLLHCSQLIPPLLFSLSVTEPAGHSRQWEFGNATMYSPAMQVLLFMLALAILRIRKLFSSCTRVREL
jgi:hypothetical protein